MTTSAVFTPGAPSRMTYTRARLLLGISGVGTAVIITTAVFVLEIPTRLLSNAGA